MSSSLQMTPVQVKINNVDVDSRHTQKINTEAIKEFISICRMIQKHNRSSVSKCSQNMKC